MENKSQFYDISNLIIINSHKELIIRLKLTKNISIEFCFLLNEIQKIQEINEKMSAKNSFIIKYGELIGPNSKFQKNKMQNTKNINENNKKAIEFKKIKVI